jgi:hypothetical protein
MEYRFDRLLPDKLVQAYELLASDRLREFSGTPMEPATSRGTLSAQVTLGMPLRPDLPPGTTQYAINMDVANFAAERLVMGQKVEANNLRVTANNQGYQVKGDVKINGQMASLDYRKPNDGDADIKLQATLDDSSRARLGFDLGPAVSGAIPIKLIGKIGAPDRDSRMGIEADLTSLKLDNILPGWVKLPGKSSRAVFNVVQKPQSTRFEDIVIEAPNASVKGMVEVDSSGDVISANFPVFSLSNRDKATLKAERGRTERCA